MFLPLCSWVGYVTKNIQRICNSNLTKILSIYLVLKSKCIELQTTQALHINHFFVYWKTNYWIQLIFGSCFVSVKVVNITVLPFWKFPVYDTRPKEVGIQFPRMGVDFGSAREKRGCRNSDNSWWHLVTSPKTFKCFGKEILWTDYT